MTRIRRRLMTRWYLTPQLRLSRLDLGRFRWRAGLLRREWWIGVRCDFAMDAVLIGFLGAVVVICRDA